MIKIFYGVLMALVLAMGGPLAGWGPSAQAQTVEDGLAAQRARLVQGLDLKPAQQKKLDAILTQSRPKLAAAAALPSAQQAPARRKLMDDMHLHINAMLTPDQRAAYELMQARSEERRNAQAAGGKLATAPIQ